MTKPMLELDHARKHYPGFILDVSMRILPGSITALVGANGSGKTTVFRLALGLAHPDGGSVTLMGRPAASAGAAERNRVAAVFSDSGFGPESTPEDIMAVLAASCPRFAPDACRAMLERFALPLRKPMRTFSTGMLATCKVIMAVARRPDLLVLDEPTAGLDVVARDGILDLLRGFMETPGRSILVSSHNAQDLESLCDDFYCIHDGHITLHDTVERLQDSYGLLLVDDGRVATVDDAYILARERIPGGWRLLTDQRDYYRDNMPGIAIERSGLDGIVAVMEKGETR